MNKHGDIYLFLCLTFFIHQCFDGYDNGDDDKQPEVTPLQIQEVTTFSAQMLCKLANKL